MKYTKSILSVIFLAHSITIVRAMDDATIQKEARRLGLTCKEVERRIANLSSSEPLPSSRMKKAERAELVRFSKNIQKNMVGNQEELEKLGSVNPKKLKDKILLSETTRDALIHLCSVAKNLKPADSLPLEEITTRIHHPYSLKKTNKKSFAAPATYLVLEEKLMHDDSLTKIKSLASDCLPSLVTHLKEDTFIELDTLIRTSKQEKFNSRKGENTKTKKLLVNVAFKFITELKLLSTYGVLSIGSFNPEHKVEILPTQTLLKLSI